MDVCLMSLAANADKHSNICIITYTTSSPANLNVVSVLVMLSATWKHTEAMLSGPEEVI